MREVTVFLHSQKIERRSSAVRDNIALHLRRSMQMVGQCAHSVTKFWTCDQAAPARRRHVACK